MNICKAIVAAGGMMLAQIVGALSPQAALDMSINLEAIVLAAGRSSRFKHHGNKLIAKLCGQEMVLYPLRMLHGLGISATVVLSPQGNQIRSAIDAAKLSNIYYQIQDTPGGTGHAVKCARSQWTKNHILILNGDTPLVTDQLVQALFKKHIEDGATVSFVTCEVEDPCSIAYGRVLEEDGKFKIIEQKDCTAEQLAITRVNAGIYLVEKTFLQQTIEQLQPSPISGEIYITDIVHHASLAQKKVIATTVPFDTIRGVNKLEELAEVEHIKRSELIAYWQARGVRFMAPNNTYLDYDVTIGEGVVIGAGVHVLNGATIGARSVVGPYSIIDGVSIDSDVKIAPHAELRKAVKKIRSGMSNRASSVTRISPIVE